MALFFAVAARKLCGWAWQFAASSLAKLLCIVLLPHRRLITFDNQRVIGKEYDSVLRLACRNCTAKNGDR
tara:strand:+ start:7145 stop:7354 length:210 start_codon:yes stop_codon:yes gene_type:complete